MNTVLITGAGHNLGLFMTEQFLRSKWRVLAVTRGTGKALPRLRQEALEIIELNGYDGAEAVRVARVATERAKRIQAVIHNASIYQPHARSQDQYEAYYTKLFQVHMLFPALMNEALRNAVSAPDDPGNIIHVSDIYAENPYVDDPFYCSSKAGLENLTKGLAKKYAPTIRVNSILPGALSFLPQHNAAYRKRVLEQIPLPFAGGFLPIYQTVRFIIDNNYLTGASIKVDGGKSIGRF